MNRILPFVAALVLASGSALAQAPQGDAKPKPRRFDCSQAKDPKACEERVQKARAMRDKAREACKSAQGADQRDCMRRELCAQTQDPAKCEARAKQHAERRAKLREACKDKTGEELRSCLREHRRGERPAKKS
jgi:hypothetical protein